MDYISTLLNPIQPLSLYPHPHLGPNPPPGKNDRDAPQPLQYRSPGSFIWYPKTSAQRWFKRKGQKEATSVWCRIRVSCEKKDILRIEEGGRGLRKRMRRWRWRRRSGFDSIREERERRWFEKKRSKPIQERNMTFHREMDFPLLFYLKIFPALVGVFQSECFLFIDSLIR